MTTPGSHPRENRRQIRRAHRADLPAITEVVEAAYARYIPRIGKRPAPMDEDYAGFIAADPAVAEVFVSTARPDRSTADPGHSTAGPGQFTAGSGHSTADSGPEAITGVLVVEHFADHLHVLTIAVHPTAHGTGTGRALMDHAEQLAGSRGVPEIRLYTNEQMTENLTLYPHLGFHETDRRFDGGYHRVFYAKPIPPEGM